jgi:hypothetical protein
MSDQQPEALLLADELQAISKNPWAKHWERCLKAAAELRRLHEVEKQRDELLAVLDSIGDCDFPDEAAMVSAARAALAKARKQ